MNHPFHWLKRRLQKTPPPERLIRAVPPVQPPEKLIPRKAEPPITAPETLRTRGLLLFETLPPRELDSLFHRNGKLNANGHSVTENLLSRVHSRCRGDWNAMEAELDAIDHLLDESHETPEKTKRRYRRIVTAVRGKIEYEIAFTEAHLASLKTPEWRRSAVSRMTRQEVFAEAVMFRQQYQHDISVHNVPNERGAYLNLLQKLENAAETEIMREVKREQAAIATLAKQALINQRVREAGRAPKPETLLRQAQRLFSSPMIQKVQRAAVTGAAMAFIVAALSQSNPTDSAYAHQSNIDPHQPRTELVGAPLASPPAWDSPSGRGEVGGIDLPVAEQNLRSVYYLKPVDYAETERAALSASKRTGVRPALLIALAERETQFGKVAGDRHFRNVMTTSQQKAFLETMAELGLDPNVFPVSSAGEMGYTQMRPEEWRTYAARAAKDEKNGDRVYSPADVGDATLLAAYKIRAHGGNDPARESDALQQYNGGNRRNAATQAYADRVLQLAEQYETRNPRLTARR